MAIYDDHPVDPFGCPAPRPRRLDDARTSYEVLDATVPLGTRWPDWRWTQQSVVFTAPGLPVLVIEDLDREGVVAVLAVLYEHADALHAQAAQDEEAAVSSALAWTFRELAVPHVRACTATAWLHSTTLVRALRNRLRA